MQTQERAFEQIFSAADAEGAIAARSCVPEPIIVEGEIYPDGDCGGAYFEFDGRSSFGRWLRFHAA